MSALKIEQQRLVWESDHQTVWVEPWGSHGIRVRANVLGALQDQPGALDHPGSTNGSIRVGDGEGTVANGRVRVSVSDLGWLTVTDLKGRVLLQERWRNRDGSYHSYDSQRGKPRLPYDATLVPAREFRGKGPGFQITQRWEAQDGERLYGMGQYQDGLFDLKGSVLELAQRNSQITVPYLVSSRGYGILWNNPAVGKVMLGTNFSEWVAETSMQLDYWVTAGDTPADMVEAYTEVTGRPPVLPEFALGFWQCKLRYKTQEELLSVAREYRRRGLPLSVIVADFFHWPQQGDWRFDPRHWPDPRGLVEELTALGIRLVVSVWPTVDKRSENYAEMLAKGYLVRSDRGVRTSFEFMGSTVFFDATHPDARSYVWSKLKQNYHDLGVAGFWLDVAEPEYSVYDFDNYRYHLGSTLAVGNLYPVGYAQTVYEGQREAGASEVVTLIRSAWAGSQKYAALVWSGDIDTTFETLRRQMVAGLHLGLAGIPWWNTDIGGFAGGDQDDPDYRELLVRWFQFGTFSPVMRLHGFRVEKDPAFALMHSQGNGSDDVFSGGANEVWSYGPEAYDILVFYLKLRERLRPYLGRVFRASHQTGAPVMRPLFYDFPDDPRAWDTADQYLLGPDVLVCPILELSSRSRMVWLPAGTDWINVWTGEVTHGGREAPTQAPLDQIPVFVRVGAEVWEEVWSSD